jgi:hypothetical protein
LLLDQGDDVQQVARLEIQLKQVIDVRFGSAEFDDGLELVEIPQTIDLLADLRTGCSERVGTTVTARKT